MTLLDDRRSAAEEGSEDGGTRTAALESAYPATAQIPVVRGAAVVDVEVFDDRFAVLASFDGQRCHCGDLVAAVDNVNSRTAANWKWCKRCGAQRFCREEDRCAGPADVQPGPAPRLARPGPERVVAGVGALAAAALLAGALSHRPGLALAAAAVGAAVDALLEAGRGPISRTLAHWHLDRTRRALLRAALIAVAVTVGGPAVHGLLAAVLAPVVAIQVGRMLSAELSASAAGLARRTVVGANLPGPRDARPVVAGPPVADLCSASEVLLWAGTAAGVLLGLPALVIAAGAVVAVLAALLTALAAVVALRARSAARRAGAAAVRPGLDALRPAVVLAVAHQDAVPDLSSRLAPLVGAAPAPALLVLREARGFRAHRGRAEPTLLLPGSTDTEVLERPSIDLVLHGGHTPRNHHLLRMTGVLHCLLDPGAEPARPTARMYDEVWVADEARRAEYLALRDGVAEVRVRVVPGLGDLVAGAPGCPPGVVEELRLGHERALVVKRERADAARALEPVR